MMKEDHDPEKWTLLLQKKRDKKKKAAKTTKTDDRQTGESLPQEPTESLKSVSNEPRAAEPRESPYRRESEQWKVEKEPKPVTKKNSTEDTYSCGSCALKKIVGSEYTCMLCVLFICSLSIALALFLVFRSCPSLAEVDVEINPENPAEKPTDSRKIKAKTGIHNVKRSNSDNFGRFNTGVDDLLAIHTGIDFDKSFRESNGVDEAENIPGDWSLVDNDKNFYELQRSEKLKDFYKKLVQIDAQIKKMKKAQPESYYTDRTAKTMDRNKRSLIYNHPHTLYFKVKRNNRPKIIDGSTNRTRHNKNSTGGPTGIFYENKKIVVQYEPIKKVVAKCSHAPKDFHAHEHQLKHPFYKNTQKLDEILDRFLEQNLPDVVKDPLRLDLLFKQRKYKCKHPTPNTDSKFEELDNKINVDNVRKTTKEQDLRQMELKLPKIPYIKPYVPKTSTLYKNINFEDKNTNIHNDPNYSYQPGYENDILKTGTNTEVDINSATKFKSLTFPTTEPDNEKTDTMTLLNRVPNLRKLKQINEEDDENLGYEDFKEVLTDNVENQDDTENGRDRKKREPVRKDQPASNVLANLLNRKVPPIQNPNWKGPMPLYSDEINTMMSKTLTKSKIKKTPREEVIHAVQDIGGKDGEISDVEYLEDYLNNKNDKLVEMAQAYSDYGVLDGKKDSVRNDKHPVTDVIATADRKVKMLDEEATPVVARRFKKEQHENNYKPQFLPPSTVKHVIFQKNLITDDREDDGVTNILQIDNHPTTKETSPPNNLKYVTLLNNYLESIYNYRNAAARNDKQTLKTAIINSNQGKNNGVFAIGKRKIPNYYNSSTEYYEGKDEITKLGQELGNKYEKYLQNVEGPDKILKVITGNQNVSKYFYDTVTENNINDSTDDILITNLKFMESNLPLIKTFIRDNESYSFGDEFKFNTQVVPRKYESENDNKKEINNGNQPNTVRLKRSKQLMDKSTSSTTKSDIKTTNLVKYETVNNKTDKISNIDFFSKVLHWLKILDDAMNIQNKNGIKLESNVSNTIAKPAEGIRNPESSKEIPNDNGNEDDIENICYKSRMLLSIEESPNVTMEIVSTTLKTDNVSNITTTAPVSIKVVNTTKERDSNTKQNEMNKDNKHSAAISKRNADDSNLIFWNDIYDDEYGIQSDSHESSVRNTFKDSDFIKRSGIWVHDKIKKISDNIRGTVWNNDLDLKKRNPRAVFNNHRNMNTYYGPNDGKYSNEGLLDMTDEEYGGIQQKKLFAVLTKNMKEVCKKAARAVQQTKNSEVNKGSSKGLDATTLMQQLVRLLSDLVEYQVQQQICTSLPPDLQKFLTWLTEPQSDSMGSKVQFDYRFLENHDPQPAVDQITELTTDHVAAADLPPEAETLDTLQAVKDLLANYEDMNEDEKSRMMGVKAYLQNQLRYLCQKLSAGKLNNMLKKNVHTSPIRYKRSFRKPGFSQRRRVNKFVRNFSKKHTSTTVGFYDNAKVTDERRYTAANTVRAECDKNDILVKKRNLKDVYYKAVNDAKKMSTIKSLEMSTTKQNVD